MCGGPVHLFGELFHKCSARQICAANFFTCAEVHKSIDVSGNTSVAVRNGMVVQDKSIDDSRNTVAARGNTCAEVHKSIDVSGNTSAVGHNGMVVHDKGIDVSDRVHFSGPVHELVLGHG